MDPVEKNEATAQSRHSRRIRAQCRASKVRCSGTRPCERCTRRRDKCAFASDEAHVSVPERYLQDLQREIAQLKAMPTGTKNSTIQTERPAWRGSVSVSDTDPSVITPRSLDRPARSARTIEIDPPNCFTSPEIPRRNDHVFLGHTSTWSFCRRVFTLLEDAGLYSTAPRAPLNLDGAAFRLHWHSKAEVDSSDLLKLPPIDQALFLYNTVKFRLGEIFSVVDQPNFLRIFDEFHKNPLKTAQMERLWFVEYLMLLAFGKAFTSYMNTTTVAPPGSELAVRALSLLPDVAFLQDERPALLAMEVLALIALYFQSIDMRSPAYQYIGQALRLSFHDGLHRRFPEDITEAGIATHASNVWWTIYVLDQSLSAGLGCPPTIPLNSITTSLPDIQSDSISTKALALRSRLSQINSVIYSSMFALPRLCPREYLPRFSKAGAIYSFDDTLGSDFISSITSVLHKLAEVSREMEEITSGFKASKGELPQMFYNITLSHHHCIVLATRPLVIWLLIRSLPPCRFDPRILSGPIAKLLEKSSQSATTTLLILINLSERETLETFLPFTLEYAFSSAVLLSILDAILPSYVPDPGWQAAASSIFQEMIQKGNIVAKLRRAELEHLEALLEPYRAHGSSMPVQPNAELTSVCEGGSMRRIFCANRTFDLPDEQEQNLFRINWNSSDDILDPFETGPDDILVLAEQLEQDDFCFTV
ncbi:hypothetical protein N7533_003553 [Penicillium manginii]|uniref:uncharacterized protein n=1 Tax=Penicillium manginii TaxID=203109 RepID=UPI00254945D7|nr:uncharacterized protein N7533_003553 [Penicillium manginii]KAJ5761514.1 hypothetical protein N7533_003553 [Penicillium manginii]